MNNKKKGKSSFTKVIVAVMLITIFISACLFDFSQRSNHQAQKMVADHLKDVGDQAVYEVESELKNSLEEVKYVAAFLSGFKSISDEDLDVVFQKLQETCKFSRVRLVGPDGGVYSLRHEQIQSGSREYIENIAQGRSGITSKFASGVTGEDVFAIYAPVVKDGAVKGGIVGILVVEDLVDRVHFTGFESKSYSYVMEPDGSMIMQTLHQDSLYSGMDWFSFLRDHTDWISEKPADIQRKMEEAKSGTFIYQVDKESRIAYYTPCRINSWYVVTAVSTTVTDSYIQKMGRISFQMTIKIVLVFLLSSSLMIYWMYGNQKQILAAKEEAELTNKKFEQAMQRTSNILFEYSIHDDVIRFLSAGTKKYNLLPKYIKEASVNARRQGLVAPEDGGTMKAMLDEIRGGALMVTKDVRGGSIFPEEIWFRVSITAIQNQKQEALEAIGIMEDVTEEKHSTLRYAQEERYRLAILSEALCVWTLDLTSQKILTYTVNGENLLGDGENLYHPALIRKMCETVQQDDRSRVIAFMQADHLLTAYYEGQQELKETFRMKRDSWEDDHWVECTVNLISEPASGNPIAFSYVKDIDEEKKRELALTYTSERDALTGLHNRWSVERYVNEALDEAPEALCCFLMLDLDGFKAVNDQFGHRAGDEVLKGIGKILHDVFTEEDLVARMGGDEFTVFMKGIPDEDYAILKAAQVCAQVCRVDANTIGCHCVSASIGLCYAPVHGMDFDTLYQKADEALYMAKRQGKNCVITYTGD